MKTNCCKKFRGWKLLLNSSDFSNLLLNLLIKIVRESNWNWQKDKKKTIEMLKNQVELFNKSRMSTKFNFVKAKKKIFIFKLVHCFVLSQHLIFLKMHLWIFCLYLIGNTTDVLKRVVTLFTILQLTLNCSDEFFSSWILCNLFLGNLVLSLLLELLSAVFSISSTEPNIRIKSKQIYRVSFLASLLQNVKSSFGKKKNEAQICWVRYIFSRSFFPFFLLYIFNQQFKIN